MAQSGVLRVPRVQLIRGLARTKETANLSANSQQSLPQVSSPVGRHSGEKLIPAAVLLDPVCVQARRSLARCLRAGKRTTRIDDEGIGRTSRLVESPCQ